jgi:glycine cleavage system regulatory protein
MQRIVLTFMADDRPGLVRSVSDVVAAHGGNWLESRLSRLAGKFAGIVCVEVAPEDATALEIALSKLSGDGMKLIVDRGRDETPASDVAMQIEVIGADHPGIVNELAELLASRGVNVDEMTTDRRAASMSGSAMFEAHLKIRVPADLDQAALRTALEHVARDLMVDIDVSAD